MRFAALLLMPLVAASLSGCFAPPPSFATVAFADLRLPEGDATPVPVGGCVELLSILNDRALEESDALLDQWVERGYGGYGLADFAVADSAVAMSAPAEAGGASRGAGASSAADAEVTGTNNQESGVDEADIVKTDGEWSYVLRGEYLYVLRSERIGDLEEHSRLKVRDVAWGDGLLLLAPRDPTDPNDDRLVVVTSDSGGDRVIALSTDPSGVTPPLQLTHVQVVDLSDRSAPQVVKELWIEGDNVGARLVDGVAYLVVHAWNAGLPLDTHPYPTEGDLAQRGLDWREYHELDEKGRKAILGDIADRARKDNEATVENATTADHLPAVLRPGAGGFAVETTIGEGRCGQFLATPGETGRSVTTILSLGVGANMVQERMTQVLGSRPIVYAAEGALVLAAPARDPWWFWGRSDVDDATDLQWFDLDGMDVRHRASGRIGGVVQDSFGIDVHDGTLRVATTTGQWGRWWLADPEPMMNHLAVLEEREGELAVAGLVSGIAPTERIWSARFTDDRAYLVTFRQVDPLWVIDLSDPRAPRILGELEIPGVSTYIHPLSDDLLLTIGYGPRGEGVDAVGLDWSRLQVSLFDISDPHRPKRADVLDVAPPGGHAWSGAAQEHKAFTYWDRIGMLAIPVTTSIYDGHRSQQHLGLRLIEVDVAEKELAVHGSLDHDHLIPYDPEGHGHWGGGIERSYFLGHPDTGEVSVYAVSNFGMTAHRLEPVTLQSSVRFWL